MSKMSIEWHEDCLKNFKHSLERSKKTVERYISDYELLLKNYEFCKYQIDEAKRLGKDGFDSEKFRVKRK